MVTVACSNSYGDGFPSHMGDNPDGKLVDNSVQFRDFGFDLANIFKWHVSRNAFRNEGGPTVTSGTPYDMRFQAATAVTMAGNDTGTMANPDRVNILIDAETIVNDVHHGDVFLIESHQFGDGSAEFATSAILITESATKIQIGASNQFLGSFTGPVVDDPNNISVTLVGFQNPTGTSPPNVLPNSPAAAGLPTFGNTDNAWLGSYAYGQYVPPVPSGLALPSVTLGWVIYTDPISQNLYATNGVDTKQLAP